MKSYVQMFLISIILLKAVLISVYMFGNATAPLPVFSGAVAMALEPDDTFDNDSPLVNTNPDLPLPPDVSDGAAATEEKTVDQNRIILIEEREKFLARREQHILALQEEINKKIQELTRLRDEIRESLAVKKTAQENQVKHLIKIYSTMKPQKVAELIEKLDIDLIIELFSRMKGDVVGQILSFVDTGTGAKITKGLFPEGLEGKTQD